MKQRPLLAAAMLGLLASLLGCQADGAKAPANASLWERLGGERTVTAVVDDFVARAAANPNVNFTREGTPKEWRPTDENVARLKRRLVEFISAKTGGPLAYTGRPMKPVHAGMKISNPQFDAAAGDLIAALDKLKVPQKEKDELIAIIATTRDEIVELK